MRIVRVVGIIATAVIAASVVAYADEGKTAGTESPAATETSAKPIQLALAPPTLQLIHEDQDIKGVRFNLLYGRNRNVSGVDLGLVHESMENFTGIDFGIVSIVHGRGQGLQFNGFYSEATERMSGLQVGMFNTSKSMNGLQIGLVNIADDMTGIQLGLWNEIKNKEKLPIIPIFNAAF